MRRCRSTRKLLIKDVTFGSGILVFLPYRGKYTDISAKFKEIEKDVSEFFHGGLKYFGVYYDDPKEVVDQNDCRAIVGICLDRKNATAKKSNLSASGSSYKESDASVYKIENGKKSKTTLRSSAHGSESGRTSGPKSSIGKTANAVAEITSDAKNAVYKTVKDTTSLASLKKPITQASKKIIGSQSVASEGKSKKSTVSGSTAVEDLSKKKEDFIDDIVAFLNSHKNYKTINFTNLKGFGTVLPYNGPNDLKSIINKGFVALKEYGTKKNQMNRCKFAMHVCDCAKKTITFAFPYYSGNAAIDDQSGYPVPKLKNEKNEP